MDRGETKLMVCPDCKSCDEFRLEEAADDYQDGYVICKVCEATIGTFSLEYKYLMIGKKSQIV